MWRYYSQKSCCLLRVELLASTISWASWILACHRKTARKVRYLKEILVQNLSAKWTDTPRSISGT